jgi:hypothetical protein
MMWQQQERLQAVLQPAFKQPQPPMLKMAMPTAALLLQQQSPVPTCQPFSHRGAPWTQPQVPACLLVHLLRVMATTA